MSNEKNDIVININIGLIFSINFPNLFEIKCTIYYRNKSSGITCVHVFQVMLD